jgi:protein subunit release factor A
MKFKKALTIGISLAVSMGAVACAKEEAVPNGTTTTPAPGQEDVGMDNDYVEKYSKYYGDYSSDLKNYEMYSTPESLNEYYKTNEYPGNEKHLENVKAAYKDSRDKMQSFVDSLKNDAKTEDADLKEMNDNLIAEGEKTIANIDEKLKKLDEVPKDAMTKTQEEFINTVNETTTLKDENKSNFTKMLEDMNKKLDITPNEPNK